MKRIFHCLYIVIVLVITNANGNNLGQEIDPSCYQSVIKQLNESDTIYYFTKAGLTKQLTEINKLATQLNKDIHTLNTLNFTIDNIKQVNQLQSILTRETDFIDKLLQQFTSVDSELKYNLDIVKNNNDVNGKNITILINNYRVKNFNVQITQMLVEAIRTAVISQYPFMAEMLDTIIKILGVF